MIKKYAILLLLPFFLMGAAVYKSREVSQNWVFDAESSLELLEPISGKWVIETPEKLKQTLLSQTIKYADFPKALIKDHEFYDFEATTRIYINGENADVQ